MINSDHLPDGRLKRFEQWIDRHEKGLLRGAVLVMFVTSLVTAYLGFTAQRDRDKDFKAFLSESAVRRDQACRSDERKDRDQVQQLAQTYLILGSETARAKLQPGLVDLIVTLSLPQLEKDARNPDAPDYCNQPGVGLPEDSKRCGASASTKKRDLKPCLDKPPERRDFSFLLAPSNQSPP